MVIKASAGSGKTYNLVLHYLALLMASPESMNFKRILAVTFTKKATAEMKHRILEALKLLMSDHSDAKKQQKKNELLQHLIEKTGMERPVIEKRAFDNFTHILHHYQHFAVSTIDKFNLRLVKTFELELLQHAGLNLIMDHQELLAKAIDQIIDEVGTNPQVDQWILEFLTKELNDGKKANIRNRLLEFAQLLFSEDHAQQAQQLTEIDQNRLKSIETTAIAQIEDYKNTVALKAQEILDLCKIHHLSAEHFYQKSRGIFSAWEKIVKKQAFNIASKLRERDQDLFGKGVAEVPEIVSKHLELCDFIDARFQSFKKNQLIAKSTYLAGLLGQVSGALKNLKSKEGIFFNSDVNGLLAPVVLNNPVPFIYERLGERYNHYLIDEFQDTSIMQWQNFLPLIDNGLGKGMRSILVGDGKQSIYRFRGGKVEQFVHLPHIADKPQGVLYDQYETNLIREYFPEILRTNYRSFAHIIGFNNRLVEMIQPMSPLLQKVFADGQQERHAEELGYVKIKTIAKSADPEEEADLNELFCTELLSDLNSLHNQLGSWRGFCVLVSRHNEAKWVSDALVRNQIPIVTESSLLVLSDRNTQLIHAIWTLLNDPVNPTAMYQAFVGWWTHKGEEIDLMDIQQRFSRRIDDHYRDAKRIFDGKAFLTEAGSELSMAQLRYLRPSQAVGFLASLLGFDRNMTGQLQRYIEQHHINERELGLSKYSHLQWWELNGNKVSVGSNQEDAVQIMTVHKSKGLEFDHVFIPFLNWRPATNPSFRWLTATAEGQPVPIPFAVHKDDELELMREPYEQEAELSLLDDANRLYVAMTRAVKSLMVYTSRQRNKGMAQRFYDWVLEQPEYNLDKGFFELGEVNSLRYRAPSPEKSSHLFDISHPNLRPVFVAEGINTPRLDETPQTEREIGIIVHEMVERIRDITEIEPIVKSIGQRVNLDASQMEDIAQRLGIVYDRASDAGWFPYRGLVKKELIIKRDQQEIRPDLVVFGETQTQILEFKTGEAQAEHREQLKEYIRALTELGYPKVEGTLVYIHPCEFVDIQL